MPISHLPPPTTAAVPGPPPPPTGAGLGGSRQADAPAGSWTSADRGPSMGGGPPPPPPAARRGGDRRSRATAATWVAATGALLLLAAAGTFLAVAWDTMELAARVTVVAAVTGAAILGGHRLRRVLPAVGAVLFHLGALLIPVDVLGLALQLEWGSGARWFWTGTSATVAFSVLATTGRSKVLAWAAVGALPVLATGVGMLTGLAAPLVLATFALVAVGVGALPAHEPLRRVVTAAGPLLAVVAVHLVLPVAAFGALFPAGPITADLVAAGWFPAWTASLLTAALALAALALAATRQRSAVVAALVPLTAATASVLVVLPVDTPDLAVLLAAPVLALALELAALATVRDVFWHRVTRPAALTAEVIGVVAVGLAAVTLVPWMLLAPAGDADPPLALAIAVVGLAWVTAAARRVVSLGWRQDAVVGALALGSLHLLAALEVGAPGTGLVPWLLLAVAAASVAWLPLAARGGRAVHRGWPAAIALGVAGVAGAVATSWTSPDVVVLGSLAVGILGIHTWAAARAAVGDAAAALAVLLPAAVATVLLVAVSPGAGALPATPRALVVVGLLLGLAAVSDRVPVGADLVRVVAVCVALWAPAGSSSAPGLDGGQRFVLDLGAIHPAAIAVCALAVSWLAVDALRRDRPWLVALAAPVAVRGVVAVLLVVGVPVAGTGLVLLGMAAAALVAALVITGRGRLPAAVMVAVSAPTGWLLLGDVPVLRGWVTVAFGAAIVAAGLLRRRPVVGHLGGVVVAIGIWRLLTIAEVTATDLWVLPIAAQLWAAGWYARREGASSWLADVPPMLLVVVPALAERLAGGPGWHTLLAGAIGVTAVVGGGARRLGGPLVVGSIVLVAVAIVETLAIVASVPTWAWLAVAGCVLLGAAVAIERSGTTPVASARRLIEVIDERFD